MWLTQQNFYRRVKFNDAEDELTEQRLVGVVNDMLQSLNGQTFTRNDLLQQRRYGLVTPKYLLRYYSKTGGTRSFSGGLATHHHFTFDENGILLKVSLTDPERDKYVPPVPLYRERGLLIENPGAKVVRHTAPLYIFSQAGHVLGVRQIIHVKINILPMSPKDFLALRVNHLAHIKSLLEEKGAPSPRFCQYSKCGKILPLFLPHEWNSEWLLFAQGRQGEPKPPPADYPIGKPGPKGDYCSKERRQNGLKERQRQPKPFTRLEETLLPAAFELHPKHPPLQLWTLSIVALRLIFSPSVRRVSLSKTRTLGGTSCEPSHSKTSSTEIKHRHCNSLTAV
ncbi:MAG TPA: hypothetical protein VNN62_08575 [Methylomirabilota bacterium]|nr:hypothetical protein [Methylomirabilota bacterium]